MDKSVADTLLLFLKKEITDSLYLVNDDDLYTINIGYFSSSLKAGERAFHLFSDSLINKYDIYYGDSAKVYDEFRYIPFVGEDLNRPALYKYDLVRKKEWLIWSKWGRKIINFSYSQNFSPAYFLTALSYGRKAGFPFILDVRAYKYNVADNTVKRMEKLGTGLQVFANSNSSGNYEVYFNILDSVNTSRILQKKNIYDFNGEKINYEENYFHILEEGYPVPPSSLPQLVSPSKNHYLKAEGEEEGVSYFLNNYEIDKRDFIFSSALELSKVDWSGDENYVIVSLKSPGADSDSQISKLLIISTENAVIKKEFENRGAVNFIVHGDLLIFDSWNNATSQITVYDYKKELIYDVISVPGGCGLNYIKSEYIGD
ncbi:MAG: hypothetical protein F9K45_05245 [Melioribacteraceae bacterium]|nr:MAG: hypothetical protein F9K45_05245 [Melioribacteraceae bacterium]